MTVIAYVAFVLALAVLFGAAVALISRPWTRSRLTRRDPVLGADQYRRERSDILADLQTDHAQRLRAIRSIAEWRRP